jgi:competence protein ComEA
MSFYRTLLAAVAAVAIATPVFADDTAQPSSDNSAPAAQSTDTGTAAPSDQSAAPSDQSAAPSSDQSAAPSDQSATDQSAAPAAASVNLNKASAKDLMKVKGINASKARAIVAYRKKHGDFKSTDDLAKVKGFTKMKSDQLKAIQDQLSVE